MRCILVADSARHTGGVSSVLLAQAAGLAAAGIKVHLFAASGPAAPQFDAYIEDAFYIWPPDRPRDRLGEIWNRKAAQELGRYLARFDRKETVVHIHSLSMGLSSSIAPVLRKSGLSYVVTAHDAGWACPTGYFYNFQTGKPCGLEPFSAACVLCNCDKQTYLHKAFKLAKSGVMDFYSGLKQGACAFVAPSALLKERIESRLAPDVPIHVVPNPVAVRDNGPRTEAGGSFLFVGRLWEEKGIVELLEAAGNRYPLTVIGDGPLRSSLQAKYPKVIFKGWADSEEVAVEIRKSRALILPSIYLEAFGLVVPEALSQGTPVIVSDRAGAATLIANGVNGFVVDMADLTQLGAACAALSNAETALRMSQEAYKSYWAAPMSTQLYIERLLPILEKGLSR